MKEELDEYLENQEENDDNDDNDDDDDDQVEIKVFNISVKIFSNYDLCFIKTL